MVAEFLALLALASPLAETESGRVRGASSGTVWSFKNIPYAAPPVGDLRWRPPEPPRAWEGERDATEWGPVCHQVDSKGNASGSEDCLQLNVWTPAEPSGSLRPVLFWIHGGSLVNGGASARSAGLYAFDGERLVARTGLVLVTINYRLGPLGYLAHETLAREQPGRTTGNYGALDQIAALEWVRRNISGFGGDPARVTIYGQSAGSFSVCTLVASPLAAGLFTGAIMQSGGCTARPLEASRALGDAIFIAAGCADQADPAACMRSLPVADLLLIPRTVGYATTVDGYVLAAQPERLIARGEHNHVPAIIGCTSDEDSRSSLEINTEADYRQAIWNLVPVPGADILILRQYPAYEYPSFKAAYVAASSDQRFVCPARRAARAFVTGQQQPVWRYVFTHALDNATPEVRARGAWHGADLMYVFDTLHRDDYIASEAERMLVDVFAGYWKQMADTGTPQLPSLPWWPAYDAGDTYLRFDSQFAVEEGYRTRQCDFWDDLPSRRP